MDNNNYIETQFQHLDGFFSLGATTNLAVNAISINAVKTAYGFPAASGLSGADSATATNDPDGIIFLPDRNIVSTSGSDVRFFTQGLKILLVRLVPTPGLPDAIEIYPPMAPPATLQSVPATVSNTVNLNNFFSLLTSGFRDWSSLLFNYQNSQEFDYAFLDWATFKYLSEYSGFYAAGQVVTSRGLHYTRSAVSLPLVVNGNLEYVNFRTLKFAPYPLPDPLNNNMGREDIAHHIGQSCPPSWWDTVDNTANPPAPSDTELETSVAPVQHQDPKFNKDEFSGQRIRAFDLYTALNKAGYIGNRVKKITFWPQVVIWLLGRAILVVGGLLLGIGLFNALFK